MSPENRFPVFIAVSLVVFVGVLVLSLRRRPRRPARTTLLVVAAVVVVGGMVFAKWGAAAGLSWWIYYTVPAAATLLLPPLTFRMSKSETVEYLVLASLMAPAIHAASSLLLGWKEYMPFLPVPSLRELLGGAP